MPIGFWGVVIPKPAKEEYWVIGWLIIPQKLIFSNRQRIAYDRTYAFKRQPQTAIKRIFQQSNPFNLCSENQGLNLNMYKASVTPAQTLQREKLAECSVNFFCNVGTKVFHFCRYISL